MNFSKAISFYGHTLYIIVYCIKLYNVYRNIQDSKHTYNYFQPRSVSVCMLDGMMSIINLKLI